MTERPTRPRTGARRLDGIQALRGVAACLVVAFHATSVCEVPTSYGRAPFGGFWHFGRSGVDIFFVLSGFIIALVHWQDLGAPARFGPFWGKRLRRIYPPYWVATALFAVLLAVSPTALGDERDPAHVVASLLLWPEHVPPVLGVAWSLRHEMLFYAVFACAIVNRRAGILALAGWACAILVAACAGRAPDRTGSAVLSLVLSPYNLEFFAGMAVALLVRADRQWQPHRMLLAGIVGFAVTGLVDSFVIAQRGEATGLLLAYTASAAAMIYGVACLETVRRLSTPSVLVELGAASYGIYLVHIPILLVTEYAIRRIRPFVPIPAELTFVAIVAAAIVGGVVFGRLVERPLLRLVRRPAY